MGINVFDRWYDVMSCCAAGVSTHMIGVMSFSLLVVVGVFVCPEDSIKFLKRCAAALKPGGMIFLKENVCDDGFIVDSDDCSITRSHAYNVELFTKKAGLKIAHTTIQKNFPKQLFKVRMYALKFD